MFRKTIKARNYRLNPNSKTSKVEDRRKILDPKHSSKMEITYRPIKRVMPSSRTRDSTYFKEMELIQKGQKTFASQALPPPQPPPLPKIQTQALLPAQKQLTQQEADEFQTAENFLKDNDLICFGKQLITKARMDMLIKYKKYKGEMTPSDGFYARKYDDLRIEIDYDDLQKGLSDGVIFFSYHNLMFKSSRRYGRTKIPIRECLIDDVTKLAGLDTTGAVYATSGKPISRDQLEKNLTKKNGFYDTIQKLYIMKASLGEYAEYSKTL